MVFEHVEVLKRTANFDLVFNLLTLIGKMKNCPYDPVEEDSPIITHPVSG